MAATNAAPKVDGERRRRNAPTFTWTRLPRSGRQGPPPPMGEPSAWLETAAGGWPAATEREWADLWSSPQAAAWDQSGRTLRRWAELHAVGVLEGVSAVRSSEMRQIEDRHGLSPKALLQLRWLVVDDADANVGAVVVPDVGPPPSRTRGARAKRDGDPRLRSVK
jgi:hypothetical protein